VDTGFAPPANQWTHVAVVYNSGVIKTYTNGVLAHTYNGSGNIGDAIPAQNDFRIAGRQSGSQFFAGKIDQVCVYNRALSASEVAGLAGLKVAYVYGLDLVSQQRGPTTSYYGYDGLGSVRCLTDGGNGTVTDTYAFDAFGNLLAQTGNTVNNYRFAGEQWDSDLGQSYLRARTYNPNTGRFWTLDTFEGSQTDPLSLHKYLYCSANPVNRFDPTGHDGDFGSLLTSVGIQTSLQGLRLTGISIAKRVAINSLYGAIIGGAAGEWDSILGGGDPWQGFVNGAQGGALFGAAGSFRAIQPLLQVIGIGLGTTATIQAASDRHYAQAGLRGIMTALGAFTTKYWPTVEGTLEQPGSLTSAQARAWYKAQLAKIPSAVDQGADWQTKGMQAYVARLMALLRARALMSDQKAAASLPPPKTLSQLIDENSAAGQSGDGLWQSIYYSSMRSNAGVDSRFEYGDAAVPFYLWGQDDN
jgi:RHS repeat-associated protein